MDEEVLEKIRDLILEVCTDIPKEKITMDSRLSEDLGIDSLKLLMLGVRCEDSFGVKIKKDFFPRTVKELCDLFEGANG